MINFAEYEFSFSTKKGKTFCVKRFTNQVVVYVFYSDSTVWYNDTLASTMQFTLTEWEEFSMAFGNRYVKAYDPNSMNFDNAPEVEKEEEEQK